MGTEAKARDLRRETKRTLARQLEEFAHHQHRRLLTVEEHQRVLEQRLDESVVACGKSLDDLGDTLRARIVAGDELSERARDVAGRGFFGRLAWLVTGR